MADFYDEFKTCPACGDRFYRPRKCSPSKWSPQITCSVSCALRRRAGHAAPPLPVVEEERRSGGSEDWRHVASCRGEEPELFFPVGTSGPALKQIAAAKAVCVRCLAITECRDWALETGQQAGVWGGMTEDERRALKRRNARSKVKAS